MRSINALALIMKIALKFLLFISAHSAAHHRLDVYSHILEEFFTIELSLFPYCCFTIH